MKPRDYQIECHDAVLSKWGIKPWHNGEDDVFRSVVANLATSSGKTIIAAILIETLTKLGKRCLFIADTDELCAQPLKKLHSAVGIFAGLEKAKNRAPLTAKVVVGSLQTLSKKARLAKFPRNHFDFIFIDEAHRSCDLAKKITDHFKDAKTCGMTATAFRSNLADLSKWYEVVAYEKMTFDLIGEGYLPPITVQTLDLKIDLNEVKQGMTKEGRDFQSESLSSVLIPHLTAVTKVIKEIASKRQILTFLPLIVTSKMFVDICQQNGISAMHCDGTMDNREEILYRFEKKEFQLLSNSQLFSTGVDFLSCDCLLNLRPTRSVGLFRQMAGRILRCLPGVIDGIDCPEARKAAIAASNKPDSLILDLIYSSSLGLAGPAQLVSDSEDADAIAARVKITRTPEQLADIAAEVRANREEKLRDELEKKERARVAADKKRGRMLGSGMVESWLHLPSYKPAMGWEKGPMTPNMATALDRAGVDSKTVLCRGHASVLLDAVLSRQAKGKSPVHAFAQLREAGVEDPAATSLDDAIRILKTDFPMTFGKWAGDPLKSVPKGYWTYIWANTPHHWIKSSHPAVFRYVSKVVFPCKTTSLSTMNTTEPATS